MNRDGALDFDAVLLAEQREAGCPPPGQSAGLAFSGGGIRSATFNLGVIQALSELRLLRRFDYLSTISGGGYIGGWLSMFIKRRADGSVERAEEEIGRREGGLEHPAIRFLRSFSNYLTPRLGLSADTLTAVATYLRNLLLTLSVLVALLGAALILPRIAVLGEEHLVRWEGFGRVYRYELVMFAVLLVTTWIVALNLFYRPADKSVRWPWYTRGISLVALVDLPVVVAASIATCHYIWAIGKDQLHAAPWILSAMLVYVVLWFFGAILAVAYPSKSKYDYTRLGLSRSHVLWFLAFMVFALLAGALGGCALLVVAKVIAAIPGPDRLWAAAAFAPPAVILAILLTVVAHIGLMGRKFNESDRELWSVLGARLLRIAVAWAVVFAVAFYSPAAIGFANEWAAGAGGVAWIVSTLFGVFAGSSQATGKPDSKPWIEILTRAAPYVFVLGLLIILSWGVHKALVLGHEAWTGSSAVAPAPRDAAAARPGIYLHASPKPDAPVVTVREIDRPGLWDQFLAQARGEYPKLRFWFDPVHALPLLLSGLLLAVALLSWRININLFSLHHFYRNRLTRCYLGATNNDRRPHPLTGFDPEDDERLSGLRKQRPLHIVGTAINLNRGKQLAWQSRRAASFAFTPYHAGYAPASRQVEGGFRDTSEYGLDSDGKSIQLGTVMAISGAAASPNQGYHTSPAVAFLLTVFNVRLGHWCGNTSDPKAWRWRDPLFSLRYWWAELTGSADQNYPFVNLSDGGHFENLGVYELVRRRCGVILASDAGADPKYAFDDLAEAMRKCYTDFGVTITFDPRFDVDAIRPQATDKPSLRHFAIAKIVYPDQKSSGTLIYWKSSITDGMPADITHYQRVHKDFPHESTADQFFDESQFESYRHLGYEVATRSIKAMSDSGELPDALR